MNIGTLSAASGLVQALGGLSQQRQASSNAALLRRLGIAEAQEERRQVRKLIGRQRAAQAKSGVDVDQGTALDVRAQTAAEGELAALRRQFGFESAATAQEAAGRQALLSGLLQGTGTILGGVSEDLARRVPKATPAVGRFSAPRIM